ncbi:D-aminoacyl-tRNA deacylase [Microbacter margulisiae]|uniref:D-aminoacyl-tRNA deacylase n=1 Tax=Microbacter margulisiae TaxID=1350067 RepID=A0A7W5H231_9PORP|nr:D-aminoacyl-tRNA deacylase [Microbacter margulisiae]MBB3188253.1 D-tyrosyl-tRNA(Tyr) deacylase [Microbacter margulisiae]
MRAVVQRVKNASVTIHHKVHASIHQGMLVLIGVEDSDTNQDIDWLTRKIVNLRIFDDDQGVMNRSVNDIGGEMLIVSQFTLMASTCKGNRPSYIRASKPPFAMIMYDAFCNTIDQYTKTPVKTGVFGADMQVELINDGPVTIIIDTKLKE